MCKNGPKSVIELEKMGLPFSRFDNGSIYQRPFGGQSKEFGGEQPHVRRRPLTVPGMPYSTPCISKILNTKPQSSLSGMHWIW
ncbi:succinate dehydrogenase flavoprotein subunit [Photobacterium aphoticum]|uniref:Succinate dehydrogenase flavoprotein subunit n=1 Tax=Photobacterium aphoticum TaxID=754436 RepID=A0A090RCY1_9GAMM|nr:succinate dehydrogenase flavoprotein subunit [Photobacterium aphoticum]